MDLVYARWQRGLSLAFHIIFAVIGMAMPVMMVAAEAAWRGTQRREYFKLATRWARGTRGRPGEESGPGRADRDDRLR